MFQSRSQIAPLALLAFSFAPQGYGRAQEAFAPPAVSASLSPDYPGAVVGHATIDYRGPEHLRGYVQQELERAYSELSRSWLGGVKPLPKLSVELAIKDDFTRATTWFDFTADGVSRISMTISCRQEVLAGVLWHEADHVVINKHFERFKCWRAAGLRWVDEGAAVSVEYGEVQSHFRSILVNTYIAVIADADVSWMFMQRARPEQGLEPLFYSMSFTATQYLVNCSPGGDLHQRRRYFISFVEDVLERGGDLDAHLAALDHWYKIKSLSDFKSKWHRWVLESSQLR